MSSSLTPVEAITAILEPLDNDELSRVLQDLNKTYCFKCGSKREHEGFCWCEREPGF